LNFAAATHPYDKTMRIQMVSKDWNPSYYKILECFGEITGIFGVLNTSFNLHGEPNVFSPADALRTVVNSGLEYLAIGNYILKKINLKPIE
jgi:carbamoyltransferase